MTTVLAKPTTTLMTAEEFYAFVHRPENAHRWFELVRGEVIEMPPPMKRHGFVATNIGRILGNFTFQRGHGYVTGDDSGVILTHDPDTVRGLDVAVYEDARAFDELHPKYGEVPPLLAVEVLSPNDRWSRVTGKITDCLKNGVRLVWLVDPQSRDVTVYRPGVEPYCREGTQEVTGEDVLPEFHCPVAEFFRLPGEAREIRPVP